MRLSDTVSLGIDLRGHFVIEMVLLLVGIECTFGF